MEVNVRDRCVHVEAKRSQLEQLFAAGCLSAVLKLNSHTSACREEMEGVFGTAETQHQQ